MKNIIYICMVILAVQVGWNSSILAGLEGRGKIEVDTYEEDGHEDDEQQPIPPPPLPGDIASSRGIFEEDEEQDVDNHQIQGVTSHVKEQEDVGVRLDLSRDQTADSITYDSNRNVFIRKVGLVDGDDEDNDFWGNSDDRSNSGATLESQLKELDASKAMGQGVSQGNQGMSKQQRGQSDNRNSQSPKESDEKVDGSGRSKQGVRKDGDLQFSLKPKSFFQHIKEWFYDVRTKSAAQRKGLKDRFKEWWNSPKAKKWEDKNPQEAQEIKKEIDSFGTSKNSNSGFGSYSGLGDQEEIDWSHF